MIHEIAWKSHSWNLQMLARIQYGWGSADVCYTTTEVAVQVRRASSYPHVKDWIHYRMWRNWNVFIPFLSHWQRLKCMTWQTCTGLDFIPPRTTQQHEYIHLSQCHGLLTQAVTNGYWHNNIKHIYIPGYPSGKGTDDNHQSKPYQSASLYFSQF